MLQFLDIGLWDSVVWYHTLPKLPFPNILCKIKSSIFNFICKDGLSTFSSGSGWWHVFSISSKGDSQEIPCGSENGNQWLKGNKKQWRVILATWRTYFLFHSSILGYICNNAERGSCCAWWYLWPVSLALGHGLGLFIYLTDWGKFQVEKQSNQQRPVQYMQHKWALSVIVKSWTNRDLNQIRGKIILNCLFGSQAQWHQFLRFTRGGKRKWIADC